MSCLGGSQLALHERYEFERKLEDIGETIVETKYLHILCPLLEHGVSLPIKSKQSKEGALNYQDTSNAPASRCKPGGSKNNQLCPGYA